MREFSAAVLECASVMVELSTLPCLAAGIGTWTALLTPDAG